VFLSGRFQELATAAKGTLYSVTTGRFREAEPQWLLLGDESEVRTVPSVSKAEIAEF